MSESMPGIPVIMESERILCYSCYQDDDTGDQLNYWMPRDKENYPVCCDKCGVELTGLPEAETVTVETFFGGTLECANPRVFGIITR